MSAEPALATSLFADRLAEAVERKQSQLLVGLDPRPDLLPVELVGDALVDRDMAADGCARFCLGIIDSVVPYAVGVKPQLAFFEALGSAGIRAFEEVCAYARSAGLIVLVDAKRADIGSTARAYAAAYLEPRGDEPPIADALTVNVYPGRDSLEPYLAACRRYGTGLFCLVKTSNEGGRPRRRVHERARQRASQRVTQRHVRVSHHRRRLAHGGRARGGETAPRRLGRFRLVNNGRSRWRAEAKRYGAPAAFLAAVTIAVLLVRSGLNTKSAPAP